MHIINELDQQEYENREKIVPIPYDKNYCKKCNAEIPKHMRVAGKRKDLRKRTYCTTCSPIGTRKMSGPTPKYYNKGENPNVNGKRATLKCDRVCKTCGKIFGQRSRNTECSTCRNKAIRRKNKLKLVEFKGGKCIICGYNRSLKSLCFHHIDPSKKEIAMSQVEGFSFELLLKEAEKCVLLCCNCHNEVHDDLVDINLYLPKS